MDNFYMKYVRLRDARKVTDFSVSKSTGISTGSFDAWKKSDYKPSSRNLLKLAKYFGVTVDYFLEEG